MPENWPDQAEVSESGEVLHARRQRRRAGRQCDGRDLELQFAAPKGR